MEEFPHIVLWAWENPENLMFLDPRRMGVAFLLGTITISQEQVHRQPRLQPLRVPPETKLIAVVRIESRGGPLPPSTSVLNQIMGWNTMPGVLALQIDFDARLSERAWYAGLLQDLHQRLKMPLSMTALTSWCEQDGWIRGLPVAEAVPMLFRMGRGERWNNRDFDVALCRASVGIATDELPEHIPAVRRIYFFHPGAWSENDYHAAWLTERRLR